VLRSRIDRGVRARNAHRALSSASLFRSSGARSTHLITQENVMLYLLLALIENIVWSV